MALRGLSASADASLAELCTNIPVTLDTLIAIKIAIQGSDHEFKVPLRGLGTRVLPDKWNYKGTRYGPVVREIIERTKTAWACDRDFCYIYDKD
ncbi:hypothetical protein BU16DRAFT_554027 [Lophium mytilinum]|uniref:Uncharacterized protein n=1 Tax=Lophium mytilinum TaxID=390894 RepID=A0A6A6RAY8_9PEZI|nr:hypothetical protein BU16DRAFT_554027 [Lophium mytilinum]